MKNAILSFCLCFCFLESIKADEWRMQVGAANDIAVGSNGTVWSISNTTTAGGYKIQFWAGSNWNTVEGGAVRIAVDPKGNPWILNDRNQIFKRELNRWVLMPGSAIDIGIGPEGSVWVIGTDENIMGGGDKRIYKFMNGNWQVVNGGGIRISVAPNGQPFIVNNGGQIYERLNDGNWKLYSGAAKDISVSANGSIWVIGIELMNGSFVINKWTGLAWEQVEGGGTQIAVDPQGIPWITNHIKQIYKRNFSLPEYLDNPIIAEYNDINYMFSGRISTLAVNPSNNNHIIAAGETGGLFETYHAENLKTWGSWDHLTGFKNNAVTDVLIVPRGTGNEVWVTTNISFENIPKPQIWHRNMDGTWTRASFEPSIVSSTFNNRAFRIIKSKINDRLYAFGEFGFIYLDPNTDIWKKANSPPDKIISIETMLDGTVIACTSSGLYYLSDINANWLLASSSAPFPTLVNTYMYRYALKSDESGKIALINSIVTGGVQIFGTIDYGRTWQKFKSLCGVVPGPAGGYESILPVFNPTTSLLTIFVSNREQFYYTSIRAGNIQEALQSIQINNSLFWSLGFNGTHGDTRQTAILSQGLSSPKLLITSDGGIDITEITNRDNSFTWDTLSSTQIKTNGLNALQIYSVTGINKEVYFGTQDNSFGFNNNGNLINWQIGGANEGLVIEKKGNGFYDDFTLIGTPDWGFVKRKANWILDTECPILSNPGLWNSPNQNYGAPANYCKNVYTQNCAFSNGKWEWKITYDKGCTWSLNGKSSYEKYASNASIKYYFSQPPNSNAWLSCCFNKSGITALGRLENVLAANAQEWTIAQMTNMQGGIGNISNQLSNNPLYAVSPINPLLAFAVEKNTGILKKTADGGDNWYEVNFFNTMYSDSGTHSYQNSDGYNQINAICNIEFSPYDPNFILIGTEMNGLYYSKNAGDTWQKINNVFGVYKPVDFHWVSAKKILIATYGRGLFQMFL
jgi:hypothetical protein